MCRPSLFSSSRSIPPAKFREKVTTNVNPKLQLKLNDCKYFLPFIKCFNSHCVQQRQQAYTLYILQMATTQQRCGQVSNRSAGGLNQPCSMMPLLPPTIFRICYDNAPLSEDWPLVNNQWWHSTDKSDHEEFMQFIKQEVYNANCDRFTDVFAWDNNDHNIMLQFWIFIQHCFHATFQVALLKIQRIPCMPLPTALVQPRYVNKLKLSPTCFYFHHIICKPKRSKFLFLN